MLQDPTKGLLPPNNAQGDGAGQVSYTIEVGDHAATGDEVSAVAQVLFNRAPPQETPQLVHVVDAVAPTTELVATRISQQRDDYQVTWQSLDDAAGSSVKHVTVYVSMDGGAYQIWQRQTEGDSRSEVFEGEAGHTYSFLALATDNAGNRELPPFGFSGPDDGSRVNLGGLTTADTTAPNFGIAPTPSPQPSTNTLFREAEEQIPAAQPLTQPSEFAQVLRPFTVQAFATGMEGSHAEIGPMALVENQDGTFIISGGANRSNLYRVSELGGEVSEPWVELDYPIFNLALDGEGAMWATTGGGPLLRLDPETGETLAEFGDGLTIALAIEPSSGHVYVSSRNGIEIFDPADETFEHYSRDRDLRVGGLAFDNDGRLWATTWPDRQRVVRFNERARAETMFEFDADVDSIAFGRAGTELDDLLFVSHNSAPRLQTGQVTFGGSDLTMIDLVTLRALPVARGGTRGDVVITTSDGRVLLSQSMQVDVLQPEAAPMVVATNPPFDAVVAVPWSQITVTFDQDMYVGPSNDPASVLNQANYTLIGDSVGSRQVVDVKYDVERRTATLLVADLVADNYQLMVAADIVNLGGEPLRTEYRTAFTAVTDLSALTDIDFVYVRSDRYEGTLSYDVMITNTSTRALLLPLLLVLDPALGNRSIPSPAIGQAEDGRWYVDLSQNLPQGQQLAPGESTVGHTLTIQMVEGRRADFVSGVYAFPSPNAAPQFTSVPVTTAEAGIPYEYQAVASDPDGPFVSFALLESPAGMTVDHTSGVVLWSPTDNSHAETGVALAAYDELGGVTVQGFTVVVDGGNRRPFIAPLSDTVEAIEGQLFEIGLVASDPDGDALLWRVDNLPPGAVFDPRRWTLTWTPDYESAGTYPDVRFVVSDGWQRAEASVTLLVAPVDRPPVVVRPPDRTIREGERLRFHVQAEDPDHGAISFSSALLPPGALLHPETGLFDWTPAYDQAGTYEIPWEVSDSQGTVTAESTIEVLNVNAPPVFGPLQGLQVAEGQPLSLRAFAFDPDNPHFVPPERNEDGTLVPLGNVAASVTYSIIDMPVGATFDEETGVLRWEPDYDQAGEHVIQFTGVDDGNGTGLPASATLAVSVSVINTNRHPQIDPLPNVTIQRDETRDIEVQVVDPDGNPIVIEATSDIPGYPLPPFMTLQDRGDGTAVLRVEPQVGDLGDFAIRVTASDDGDGGGPAEVLADSDAFVVSVESQNEPPQFDPLGDRVAVTDQSFELLVRARDLNAEPLTFTLAGLPIAATLTPQASYGTALLQWTPDVSEVGSYSVTIEVTDGGNGDIAAALSDQLTFELIVRQDNNAPLLKPIGALTVAENDTLTVALEGIDTDGDWLSYGADNLPPGADVDPYTGILSWTPNFLQAGVYEDLRLFTGDGRASGEQFVTITVTDTNRAPALLLLPTQYSREDSLLQFTIGAIDPDEDPIDYSVAQGMPEGATFDVLDGTFQWQPDFDQARDYVVTFAARDSGGLVDTMDVALRIGDWNRPPSLYVSDHTGASAIHCSSTSLPTILTLGPC